MPTHIPKFWASATGSARNPHNEEVALKCFGHSDVGVPEARAHALGILARLGERVRTGAPWPDKYGYADRPIREEILRELRAPSGSLDGYVTRNGYGATVLNSAGVLFADVDDVRIGLLGRLRRLFRSRAATADNPHGLPASILAFSAAHPSWTLRVYRTFAGWRVLATHDVFAPDAESTVAALREMGSDPQYVQLSKAQRCFRARLSPKPWRCGIERPNRAFPREDATLELAHQRWLQAYLAACEPYATCRLVTVLGRGRTCAEAARVIEVHDEATRAERALPLA
jgi:hypothetical protein